MFQVKTLAGLQLLRAILYRMKFGKFGILQMTLLGQGHCSAMTFG